MLYEALPFGIVILDYIRLINNCIDSKKIITNKNCFLKYDSQVREILININSIFLVN